jgi:DNA-binding transcriptional ArsR family regulator
MSYQQALQALADPTRRAVFDRIRARASSVTELAEGLPVSRPAVSQHLKLLKNAGLVTERKSGTRRIYAVNLQGVAELRRYLDGMWDDALAAFKAAAEPKRSRRRER